MKEADEFSNNIFSILGSSIKKISKIPWHTDIRLQEINPTADSTFNPTVFYKEILLTPVAQNM